MTLGELLLAAWHVRGSDLHLAADRTARVRVDGRLRSIGDSILTSGGTRQLIFGALTEAQRARFEATGELDASLVVPGADFRVRANVFMQRGSVGAAFRLIASGVPSLDELGMPATLRALADRPRGLVLVTGATGSGKSTTLAAMLDRINATQAVHILTIEDPIEHVHEDKRALVNQRELHGDTPSFAGALRAALREDPDVILVGEMRDAETMQAALTLAETGHLTLATLHTNSAAQAVCRLVDAFPAHQQAHVRAQLSLVLEGVVYQTLVPKAGGTGRVAAVEILVATRAVRALIRENKVHQIYGAMQAGQDLAGMRTLNQSLAALVGRGAIKRESALATSPDSDELRLMLGRTAPRASAYTVLGAP